MCNIKIQHKQYNTNIEIQEVVAMSNACPFVKIKNNQNMNDKLTLFLFSLGFLFFTLLFLFLILLIFHSFFPILQKTLWYCTILERILPSEEIMYDCSIRYINLLLLSIKHTLVAPHVSSPTFSARSASSVMRTLSNIVPDFTCKIQHNLLNIKRHSSNKEALRLN